MIYIFRRNVTAGEGEEKKGKTNSLTKIFFPMMSYIYFHHFLLIFKFIFPVHYTIKILKILKNINSSSKYFKKTLNQKQKPPVHPDIHIIALFIFLSNFIPSLFHHPDIITLFVCP